MRNDLGEVLNLIGEEYQDQVSNDSRYYIEVDIGAKAENRGYAGLTRRFHKINAIVRLKHPLPGMRVRIDGRTFVDYAQFDSGVAVPGYVARESGLPFRLFVPNDSMILNFA
ncbi:MAG: hypothetical protein WAK57_01975 [Desulfobacterales bacterium]|jgi:hypothetical protein